MSIIAQTLWDFDGRTYERAKDRVRLNAQLQRVFDVLADHQWHTPTELEQRTGDNWASISARCRDLRKLRFGSHIIDRRRIGGGLFSYRLRIRQFPTGGEA